jgi:hypothetical protein
MQRVIGFCSSSSKAWLFFSTFLHHGKKVETSNRRKTDPVMHPRHSNKLKNTFFHIMAKSRNVNWQSACNAIASLRCQQMN